MNAKLYRKTTSSLTGLRCLYIAILKESQEAGAVALESGYYQVWAGDKDSEQLTVVDLFDDGYSHIVIGRLK